MRGDIPTASDGQAEEPPRAAFRNLPDFVQRLSRELERMALDAVADQPTLEAALTDTVRAFVQNAFERQKVSYAVWSRAEEAALEEIELFGTSFEPAIAVDVDGVPCVGIVAALVEPGQEPADAVASALGRALVYSRAYPASLAFVCNLGRDDPLKHPFDREMEADLWAQHKVRVILRRRP